tara:strand:+ start:2046 stop:3230 length:1185 start_codon:yes stop_codon:yes gene_type:complete
MAEEIISKQMTLLPEYQENFLKDLLANIYQVDPDTKEVTGIASKSPLYGEPILDASGNQMFVGADGTPTSDASQARVDQYGNPVMATDGGVAAPDVIRFTDAQQKALNLLTGDVDPDTGEYTYSGIGAFQDELDRAKQVQELGVSAVDDSMGRYDPQGQIVRDADGNPMIDPTTGEPMREGGYKDFYDPFVEDVIDTTLADIRREGDIANIGARAEAVGAGAFGGSRQAIAEQELQRNIEDRAARTAAQLRSAAYTGAQNQAQSAFENQMKRGQGAGQLFQSLGTGIGALGEAQQALGQKDVNALFNVGSLEQQQLQSEYDVQRAAQLEEAYEPFARFSYMRDILSGVPSSGTSLAASATPQASPLANVLGGASTQISAGGGQPLLGGLGQLKR